MVHKLTEEALVITLREGVEAALIVALIVTHLKRTNQVGLLRWVYADLLLGIGASFLGIFALRRIGLDPESELLEGLL